MAAGVIFRGFVAHLDTTVAVCLIVTNLDVAAAGFLEQSSGDGPLPAALGPAVIILNASLPIE